MNDDRALELLSAAADGELGADDRAELDQLLLSSTEARESKAELEALDSLLKGLPELEPPAYLHAQIMARANPTTPPQRPAKFAWLGALVPGAGLRYALAAATGALVAAIFITTGSMLSDPDDVTDLVGTMAPNAASANTDVIDSFAFRDAGFESDVQLERSNGSLFLNVQMSTAAPLEISVDMAGAGLKADAIAQIESDFDLISLVDQALSLRAVGEQRLTILLRRVDDTASAEEAKISLEFSSDGRLLQRGTLTATL